MGGGRDQVDGSAYGRSLGVVVAESSDDRITLELPFHDHNANPGDALHGGCAASLGVIGARALAGRLLGSDAAPFHTVACQVDYLAAAIAEPVTSMTRLLRRGKAMLFAATMVTTDEGKPIAQISSVVRGRSGAAPVDLVTVRGDDGASDPGEMGPFIGMLPFAARRGLVVEHMSGGTSRIVMPFGGENADLDGGVHEGAMLALLDTTGAMASWAETGTGRYKASTAALQGQITDAAPTGDLVGFGRVTQRDGELFWSDVEIACGDSGRCCARGTVIYRIVT